MQIETLHNRRCDDWIATDIAHKLDRVFNSFLSARAFSGASE
jgi:hypothetical protein